MTRLIVVIVLAALLGVGGGMMQHKLQFGSADERFGDLAALMKPSESGAEKRAEAPAASSALVEPISDSSSDAKAKAPKVQIPGGTTHDFGTMQQGSSKKHTFMFKNIGEAPMKLEVAGSSCRCTIGSLADSVLDPGEETGVTLEWKATGVLDEFSQTATIRTNDPDHRAVLLSVKGIVARTILIEPPQINFGDIPVGQGTSRSAFVFGYGEVPLEIKSVTWGDEKTSRMVDIKVTPIEVDLNLFKHHERCKGAARIDLTVKNGMPLGPINSRLIVDTNIENVSNVDLQVGGAIVGDIGFLPSPNFEVEKAVLDFGTITRGTEVTRKVYLSIQGNHRHDFKVEFAESDPMGLEVSIDERKEQLTKVIYPITIKVPKDAPELMYPGTNSKNFGKVILKTSHPDIPEVKINLRLIVN